MSWNHRILAHKDYFQIHEVYYNHKGEPNAYTAEGVTIGSDSIEGLKWTLNEMKKCLDKPILSAENFPKEWIN